MELHMGLCLALIIGCLAAAPALGAGPTRGEMALVRQWTSAKFEGVETRASREVGLVVFANHGPVQMNSRAGKPMRLGGIDYTRGLYCHAMSCIMVRLPSPAKAFTSVIGVDDAAGGGSVVFSVSAQGKQLYQSDMRRGGQPGIPISVGLHGETEFILNVGDAGDGITCDQADWADAKVTLADGRELWLGDMPITQAHPAAPNAEPPFSFVYGGKPSSDLLRTWRLERFSRKLDEFRTERVLAYTDPATGLEARCVGVEYSDFPTVEWTVYLRNTGKADTAIISDIRALDTRFERGGEGEFVLNHHRGTTIAANDYEPLRTVMGPGRKERFAPPGGRPCGVVWPYFNVEWQGGGVIAVVGWPGQWSAEFSRDQANGLNVTAGQELTHLKLRPGEEVRTPLVVLQFWEGDRLRAQNTWRRWMLAHNLPRPGGKLPQPSLPAVSGNHYPGLLCNEADELMFIDRYAKEGIKLDYWWMDAGWYPNKGDWTSTGTWEVDTKRFPHGLKSVSDHAHSKGAELIVWFEPERVTPGSWLYQKHPEWLLGEGDGQKLLDLGNADARRWLTDHIDKLITEQGIDLYRQDYNIDPLGYWRSSDAEDRQGITENRYITGYLAYWDELLKRHPDMLIDSCASGGHRNDLETLRRSVPLLRSDYIFDPVGEQCHTYGFASWVPYWGTGFISFDEYVFRSTMGPSTTLGPDVRRSDIDWPLLRRLVGEWRELAPNYYGDYYPLTPFDLSNDTWIAWQFDRPEAGEGMVQAFRRAESVYESARLRLHGLDPAARYRVKSLNSRTPAEVTGREMMDPGLLIGIPARPGAVVVTYRKVR